MYCGFLLLSFTYYYILHPRLSEQKIWRSPKNLEMVLCKKDWQTRIEIERNGYTLIEKYSCVFDMSI